MLKMSILDTSSKITDLRLQPHLPGANELTRTSDTESVVYGDDLLLWQQGISMHDAVNLKMLSAKWQPFYLGFHELMG